MREKIRNFYNSDVYIKIIYGIPALVSGGFALILFMVFTFQIIHEILSNYYNFDEKQFWAADLDYSTALDVLDLTKLIEFILV